MQAVDRFSQQAGSRRFAGATWAAEEIGMPNAPGSNAILQGTCYMLLPYNFVEGAGTPFAV